MSLSPSTRKVRYYRHLNTKVMQNFKAAIYVYFPLPYLDAIEYFIF